MTRSAVDKHRILIIGGGSAGLSLAARLRRAGEHDIAVVEPSRDHYYQPLWTLVGGGRASLPISRRGEAGLIPAGVRWVQDHAAEIDPAGRTITLGSGSHIGYQALAVCPGIQLDWDELPGLSGTLGMRGVSSNYRVDLAPKTWQFLRDLRSGTAVFSLPAGPVKCPGAAQKICYLAADWYRRQGVLGGIRLVLVLPTPVIFGVPEFARVLEQVVERYGIDLRLEHELVEVDSDRREVIIADRRDGGGKERLGYDVLHVVPPQSAPDWIKAGPLADPADRKGWVQVDPHTLQHSVYPEVFALGDVCNAPIAKTGAAVRAQAPVAARNIRDQLAGRSLSARYDGYAACPFTTSRNRMLLAEFDYTCRPHPTIPFINTQRERYDMWLLKRYGLPFLYWHLMLRGLA
jgi:sulfide:quinone oxidoreductase